MKYDEFAFFNQQLAAMLRDGIPLEGALRRLCQEMRRGPLRDELQTLEADLAKGVPMADALKPRQLPELYKRMILVGVKGGDLPGALTMLADYFQRQNNVWTRLKSMMTYPLIVMFAAFLISLVLAFLWTCVIGPSFQGHFCRHGNQDAGRHVVCICDLENHLDISGGAWRSVFACGLHRFFAGDARKISLASAGVQGSHRFAHRVVVDVADEKRRPPAGSHRPGGTILKPVPPPPPICSNGGANWPPAPRNFPRSPPATGWSRRCSSGSWPARART